jgi:hypothetical protein
MGNGVVVTDSGTDVKAQLRQRAQRAILTNALLRWESAVLIGLTLIGSAALGLATLVGALSWLWPAGGFAAGLVAWAAVFASSLTDEQDNARAVAIALRDRYSPKQLQSPKLRAQVDKALGYSDLLLRAVQGAREGILRDRLARAVEPVNDWVEAIYELASRVDSYALNKMIQQDIQSVPQDIADFKHRLDQENDPALRATMEKTIADKERQWEQLSQLHATMEKAEYQLESTLAMLGTIYAQLQAIDVQATERGRDEQLRQEINEQVQQLQDLRGAMDEVYTPRSERAG